MRLRSYPESNRFINEPDGEHGVVIIAPMIIRPKDGDQANAGDEDRTVPRFKAIHVFAASETAASVPCCQRLIWRKRFGHFSLSSTQVYLNTSPERLAEMCRRCHPRWAERERPPDEAGRKRARITEVPND